MSSITFDVKAINSIIISHMVWASNATHCETFPFWVYSLVGHICLYQVTYQIFKTSVHTIGISFSKNEYRAHKMDLEQDRREKKRTLHFDPQRESRERRALIVSRGPGSDTYFSQSALRQSIRRQFQQFLTGTLLIK